MKQEYFLEELEDILQREEPCSKDDVLEGYEEWDSLSKMSLMAFYDKNFGVKLTLASFNDLETVEDLIKLAEGKVE